MFIEQGLLFEQRSDVTPTGREPASRQARENGYPSPDPGAEWTIQASGMS